MSHVTVFLPVYLQSMHVLHVETWVGALYAVIFLLGLPLIPFWGIWAQKYGEKPVIIRSAFVEMVVLITLGLSHSLFGVFVAMILVGLQFGNTGIMLAAIRQAVPENRVGFAVSLFSVSSLIGTALGPLAGGVLTSLNLLNLHGLYVMDGILSFLAGSMLIVFYRRSYLLSVAYNSGPEKQPQPVWKAAFQSVRFTVSLRVTQILFAIYGVLMMAYMMIMPYLPIAIEKLPLHWFSTTFSIGGLMGLSSVVASLFAVVGGRLGDKVGFVPVLILALVCSTASAFTLGLSLNVAWFILALTVFSVGFAISGAMMFALLSTRIPETHRSTTLNLALLPAYLGGIVGPAIAPALVQFGLFGPFLGASLLFAFGTLMTVVSQRSN